MLAIHCILKSRVQPSLAPGSASGIYVVNVEREEAKCKEGLCCLHVGVLCAVLGAGAGVKRREGVLH